MGENDELGKESIVENKVFVSVNEDPIRRKYKIYVASSCIITNATHLIIAIINQVTEIESQNNNCFILIFLIFF